MNKNQRYKRPLISICIPTYNRASNIEALFKSLKVIKEKNSEDVEICVSNNNSTDNTNQIIEVWRDLLELKMVVQGSNIGGTLNAIEVTKLATGRWVQIIGDDDAFCPDEFSCLIKLLQTQKSETWVLVGVGGLAGRNKLFDNLANGRYSSNSFRTKVLRTSLDAYGFIGMHIIPVSWLPAYHELSLCNARGWPHLALFVRYLLSNGDVVIYEKVVVEQAVGTPVLFWKISDWVRVSLGRIDLLSSAKKDRKSSGFFINLLILRELYAFAGIKNMILWKALEEKDFDERAVTEYFARYRHLGINSIFSVPHGGALIFLRFISARVFKFFLSILGYGKIVSDYEYRKSTMTVFDGISRIL